MYYFIEILNRIQLYFSQLAPILFIESIIICVIIDLVCVCYIHFFICGWSIKYLVDFGVNWGSMVSTADCLVIWELSACFIYNKISYKFLFDIVGQKQLICLAKHFHTLRNLRRIYNVPFTLLTAFIYMKQRLQILSKPDKLPKPNIYSNKSIQFYFYSSKENRIIF